MTRVTMIVCVSLRRGLQTGQRVNILLKVFVVVMKCLWVMLNACVVVTGRAVRKIRCLIRFSGIEQGWRGFNLNGGFNDSANFNPLGVDIVGSYYWLGLLCPVH